MLVLLDVIIWTVVGTSLFWWFYKLLVGLYDRRAQRRIDAAPNVLEASEIRKVLLRKRKWTLVIYFAIAILICLLICIASCLFIYESHSFRYLLTFLVIAFVLFIQLHYERSKQDLYGNISFMTSEAYLAENPEFYLYLRGFEDDVLFREKHEKRESLKFREAGLAEAIEYGIGLPLCALGMTKEVDSPIGAVRVYVDDEDWQEKVLLLMNKAERIFILINSRKSCLWEIGQARTMKDKIVFIVDSMEKYVEVREKFGDEFEMPEPPAGDGLFFFEPGGPAKAFADTLDGYLSVLNLSLEIIEPQKLQERKENMLQKKQEDAKTFVIGAVVAVIVLPVLFLLLSMLAGILQVH